MFDDGAGTATIASQRFFCLLTEVKAGSIDNTVYGKSTAQLERWMAVLVSLEQPKGLGLFPDRDPSRVELYQRFEASKVGPRLKSPIDNGGSMSLL